MGRRYNNEGPFSMHSRHHIEACLSPGSSHGRCEARITVTLLLPNMPRYARVHASTTSVSPIQPYHHDSKRFADHPLAFMFTITTICPFCILPRHPSALHPCDRQSPPKLNRLVAKRRDPSAGYFEKTAHFLIVCSARLQTRPRARIRNERRNPLAGRKCGSTCRRAGVSG